MKRFLSIIMSIILTMALIPVSAFPVSAAGNVVTSWTGTADDLYLYHEHTKGSGVPIFIMPVHFGASDLAPGGRLQTASKWAADVVLDAADEFFNDFRDYLDIYVYIQSEAVYPVPTNGYVSSWGEKMNKAQELTRSRLGKSPDMARIVYLGNCDNTGQTAGQVGGHAYGRQGAMLSWGNNASNQPWQDNPPYWARHEFFGHGFAGFSDEYLIAQNTGDSNLVISAEKPTNGCVPWYDFLGFKETSGSNTYEIGIYTHNSTGYNGWFPVKAGFMHDSNPFISQYHKWVVYKTAMEYAGTPKTLADFCTMQGITLNPPVPDTPKDALLIAARNGGTHQLQGNVTLNTRLDILKDFTLDLNGYAITVNVNEPFSSAVQIGAGKTFTINDSGKGSRLTGGAGALAASGSGGSLTVTCGTGAGINTTNAALVVNGGTLDITGGDWSAGIGGRQGDNGTVIINGGTVIAKGDMQSAAIGGGSGGGGGSITINGGFVTATGGNSSVNDIGYGTGGAAGSVTITGGSVNAARKTIGPAPTNGSDAVYMAALTLTGLPDTQITSLTSPAGYGASGLRTDGDSKLYLWLPQGAASVALSAAGGIEFTGAVTVTTDNSSTAVLTPVPGSESAPSILSQPSDKSVAEGKNAVFSVSASGYPIPAYQWQVSADNGSSWTNISGAVSAALTLTNVTIAEHNGRQYRCVITNTTNQLNTVISNAAALTVTQGFGPNPATGVFDVTTAEAAMFMCLAASAALWGYIFYRRRRENG